MMGPSKLRLSSVLQRGSRPNGRADSDLLEARGRTRVLIVRPTMGQGGADRVTLTLLEKLDRSRFELALALIRPEGVLIDRIPSDVSVYPLGARGTGSAWLPLSRLIARTTPDVVFSTSSGTNTVAAIARGLARRPARLVLSERNVLFHGPRSVRRAVSVEMKRQLYPFADCVTAVSEGVKRDLVERLGLAPASIEVVYNPVVSREIRQLSSEWVEHPWFAESVPIVLSAGRLVWEKDFDTLMRAFAQVRRERRARLVLLGDGPLRSELAARARELGIEEDVWLAGFVDNPFKYMARCRVFVLSSRQEGLPGVLIQAMACGAAVVATDCHAGPAEIVTHAEDGWLVPVGGAMEMAQRIGAVIDDESLRCTVGARAARRAESFGVEKIMPKYVEVLLGSAVRSVP